MVRVQTGSRFSWLQGSSRSIIVIPIRKPEHISIFTYWTIIVMFQVRNSSHSEVFYRQSAISEEMHWWPLVSLLLGTYWGFAPFTLPFTAGGKSISPGPNKSLTHPVHFKPGLRSCDIFRLSGPGHLHAVKVSSCETASRRVVTEGSELSYRWESWTAWGRGGRSLVHEPGMSWGHGPCWGLSKYLGMTTWGNLSFQFFPDSGWRIKADDSNWHTVHRGDSALSPMRGYFASLTPVLVGLSGQVELWGGRVACWVGLCRAMFFTASLFLARGITF